MLSFGAQRLADAKAVVQEPQRRGDAGLHQRHQQRQDRHADDGHDDRHPDVRLRRSGSPSTAAATPSRATSCMWPVARHPDFDALGYGLALCSDATVSDDGTVVGDPTEAALVVLAAKMGVDARQPRGGRYPRAGGGALRLRVQVHGTFHRAEWRAGTRLVELVKGAPDVVLDRCTQAYVGDDVVPIERDPRRAAGGQPRAGCAGAAGDAFALRLIDPDELDSGRRPTRWRMVDGPGVRGAGRHHRPAAPRGARTPCRPRCMPASTSA